MFYIYLLFAVVNCQDFFLAQKNNSYVCITNSSSALSWIVDEIFSNSTLINHVSSFIPEPRQNDFDCDIGYDHKTSKYFLKKPWTLSGKNSEVVLDRRWEEMKTYFTSTSSEDYITVASDLKFNFTIPFSLRIRSDAYISICDAQHPIKSNCYRLELATRRGLWQISTSKYRGYVPRYSDRKYFPHVLSGYSWSHFVLTKNVYHLALTLVSENKSQILLELNDDTFIFNTTYMLIWSNYTRPGLWKIHELNYIFTTEETNEIQLGSTIPVEEQFGSVCMFVTMCSSCQMKIALKWAKLSVYERTFDKLEKWTEIKLTAGTYSGKLELFVSTIGKNKTERFWGIDNIRLCRKKEFRKINLTQEATCQLISENKRIFFEESTINPPSCPEDTIGTFCVPCQWVYENCDQIKICTQDKSHLGCWCSAGYTNVPYCNNTCTFGHYGHDCNQKCGHCGDPRKCDKRNGSCSSCSQNYVEPKCDRLPVNTAHDLQIDWSLENDMIIEWKQSNILQSKAEKFSISVFPITEICNHGGHALRDTLPLNEHKENATFHYKVNASCLFPSTRCVVDIVTDNIYTERINAIVDISPPKIPTLENIPKPFCRDTTITFEVVSASNDAANITIFISDKTGNLYTHPELQIKDPEISVHLTKSRSVYTMRILTQKQVFIIGNDSVGTRNPPLTPETFYNVTVVLSNIIKNKTSHKIYFLSCTTSSSWNFLILLSLLALPVIPIAIFVILRRRQKLEKKITPSSVTFSKERNNGNQINNILTKVDNADSVCNSRKQNIISTYMEPTFVSKAIPLKNFHEYVEESENNGLLEQQFKVIDASRKLYCVVEGNKYFDRIDMVHSDDYEIPGAYIVSEIRTNDDLWTTICEENVQLLVLVNSENSSRYWPETNETFQYQDISIQLASEKSSLSYEMRKFAVTYKDKKKYVDQIDFSSKEVTVNKYILLLKKLAEYPLNSTSPILIHSVITRETVKRFGFILLCDMSLRMGAREGVIDVLKNYKRLSDLKADMVDDIKLYKMAHSVISEFLFHAELEGNLSQLYQTVK